MLKLCKYYIRFYIFISKNSKPEAREREVSKLANLTPPRDNTTSTNICENAWFKFIEIIMKNIIFGSGALSSMDVACKDC